MSNLLVVKGPNMGLKYSLGDLTTIGRAEDNTIQVPDPNVSRYHCRILRRGLSFRIEDVNSRNGLLVNGMAQKEKTLLSNDEIAIGPALFLFNPDRDLRNTRFSNKRVYFTSPTDETLVRLAPPGQDGPRQGQAGLLSDGRETGAEGAGRRQTDMAALVCQLGDLLASSTALPLPEALDRILRTMMEIFGARRGCLLVWDAVAGEFVPMVTISEEEELTVSQNVVRSVLEEKQAVLIGPSGEGDALPSALCVPLLGPSEVTGLLYFEMQGEADLLLSDVRLVQAVANLAERAIENSQALDRLERRVSRSDEPPFQVVGRSRAFTHAMELARKVADTNSTVLLTGETGVGKEVFAREIHRLSGRRTYPFVAINCAAIPEGLIESELFGHERGAFTGADRMRRGLIETAHGGTLFLDEVGEMPLATQVKLLRFLQDRAIARVGGHGAIGVDVRVVAASNGDLRAAVDRGRFREDLWYRLNVFGIDLPPLRERREDIQPLAEAFLRQCSRQIAKPVLGLSHESIRWLESRAWPGNIRELRNAVERAVILCEGGVLSPDHFQFVSVERDTSDAGAEAEEDGEPPALAEAERRCILRALEASDWNQVQAAQRLRIHRNTLRKKISDYGLQPSEAGG